MHYVEEGFAQLRTLNFHFVMPRSLTEFRLLVDGFGFAGAKGASREDANLLRFLQIKAVVLRVAWGLVD